MDRREALKKLAVGGAIAAGGSMVLSSNAVAQTSSGLPRGLPGNGQPLPGVGAVLLSSDKVLQFTAPPLPSGVTAIYHWNIRRFDIKHPQVDGVKLTSAPNTQTRYTQGSCATQTCGYFLGNATADVEALFKDAAPSNNKAVVDDPTKRFKYADVVTVGLWIQWTFSGRTLSAEYELTAIVGGGVTATSIPNSYKLI